jgi:hypothetical protein
MRISDNKQLRGGMVVAVFTSFCREFQGNVFRYRLAVWAKIGATLSHKRINNQAVS